MNYTRPSAIYLPELEIVTTTNSDRSFLLGMTLATVMQQVEGVTFHVLWYPDKGEDESNVLSHKPFEWHLQMIANRTNNKLLFKLVDSQMSVAHTKHQAELSDDCGWVMNLDDDLLLSPLTWRNLKKTFIDTPHDLISLGTVDAVNTRGFPDFDLTEYTQAVDYIERGKPRGKMKHHFFNPLCTDVEPVDFLSQLYVCSRRLWDDPEIWDEIHSRFNVKGVRGYDVRLEQLVRESRYYSMGLLVGQEALHMGMENEFLGGHWNSFDSETMRKQLDEHH